MLTMHSPVRNVKQPEKKKTTEMFNRPNMKSNTNAQLYERKFDESVVVNEADGVVSQQPKTKVHAMSISAGFPSFDFDTAAWLHNTGSFLSPLKFTRLGYLSYAVAYSTLHFHRQKDSLMQAYSCSLMATIF